MDKKLHSDPDPRAMRALRARQGGFAMAAMWFAVAIAGGTAAVIENSESSEETAGETMQVTPADPPEITPSDSTEGAEEISIYE